MTSDSSNILSALYPDVLRLGGLSNALTAALIVSLLPPGCGPAVPGTDDDLP